MADGAWAHGEVMGDGTWRLEIEGHFIFTWKLCGFFEERISTPLGKVSGFPQDTHLAA